jgi:hypothetical protein
MRRVTPSRSMTSAGPATGMVTGPGAGAGAGMAHAKPALCRRDRFLPGAYTAPLRGIRRGCGNDSPFALPRERTWDALRKINATAIVHRRRPPNNWWRCGRARETVGADGTDSQTRRPHCQWLSESPQANTDAHHAALPGSFVAEPAFPISDCAVVSVGFATCVHSARAPGYRLHRHERLSPKAGIPRGD